jgi:acyl-CoA hydrolase
VKKNWREDYQNKLCTAAEAAKLIKSRDSIFAGGFSMMPYYFTEALGLYRSAG